MPAYKKGNSRAGCLLCPMSGGCSDFVRRSNYTNSVDSYIDIIRKSNIWESSDSEMTTYLTSGGWINRRSGRGLRNNQSRYKETAKNKIIKIEILQPNKDCFEWLKLIKINPGEYTVEGTKTGWIFTVREFFREPSIGKRFNDKLKKVCISVSDIECAETNCKNGRLKFDSVGHPIYYGLYSVW